MRIGWIALVMTVGACTAGPSGAPTGDTATVTTSTGLTRIQTILALPAVAADGANEYTQQCLVCHPKPGDPPGAYPPLDEVVPVRTNGQLAKVVIDGLFTTSGDVIMPEYSEYFTNQDIADLIAYMRATFPTP